MFFLTNFRANFQGLVIRFSGGYICDLTNLFGVAFWVKIRSSEAAEDTQQRNLIMSLIKLHLTSLVTCANVVFCLLTVDMIK